MHLFAMCKYTLFLVLKKKMEVFLFFLAVVLLLALEVYLNPFKTPVDEDDGGDGYQGFTP